MNLKTIAKLALVGAGILTLAACSNVNSGTGVGGNASSFGAADGYGIGNQASLQSQSMAAKSAVKQAFVNGKPKNYTYFFQFASNQFANIDKAKVYSAVMMAEAKYLASHPNARVKVEGFTDNFGSREYNVGLGWRRSQAVANLLQTYGVGKNQIKLISYGEEMPLVNQCVKAQFCKNRRAHLVFSAS